MSSSAGEQQRSDASAAVSRGRGACGKPQSVPEQIALRKMIFSLCSPCLCPSDLGAGFQEQTQRCRMLDCPAPGLHLPPTAVCRQWALTDLGVTQGCSQLGLWALRGHSGSLQGACLHPCAWQSQPAVPTLHFRASGPCCKDCFASKNKSVLCILTALEKEDMADLGQSTLNPFSRLTRAVICGA